jgi:hypothetical protein
MKAGAWFSVLFREQLSSLSLPDSNVQGREGSNHPLSLWSAGKKMSSPSEEWIALKSSCLYRDEQKTKGIRPGALTERTEMAKPKEALFCHFYKGSKHTFGQKSPRS